MDLWSTLMRVRRPKFHMLCLGGFLGSGCLLVTSCESPRPARGGDRIAIGGPTVTVEPAGRFRVPVGYLRVYTETRTFHDGDVTYYPHRPYKIYDESGELVRKVSNHRSNYDERPMTVELAEGNYLVVPEGSAPGHPRIRVVIKGGEITKVDVERLLRGKGSR